MRRPKKQSGQVQKNSPPKIDFSLLSIHHYFETTFEFKDNEAKMICYTCRDGYSIYLEKGQTIEKKLPQEDKSIYKKRWLPYHLTNQGHIRFENNSTGLKEARALFGKELSQYNEQETSKVNTQVPASKEMNKSEI